MLRDKKNLILTTILRSSNRSIGVDNGDILGWVRYQACSLVWLSSPTINHCVYGIMLQHYCVQWQQCASINSCECKCIMNDRLHFHMFHHLIGCNRHWLLICITDMTGRPDICLKALEMHDKTTTDYNMTGQTRLTDGCSRSRPKRIALVEFQLQVTVNYRNIVRKQVICRHMSAFQLLARNCVCTVTMRTDR